MENKEQLLSPEEVAKRLAISPKKRQGVFKRRQNQGHEGGETLEGEGK